MIPYRTVPEVHLGPLTLHTFGVAVAAGAVLGFAVLLAYGRRRSLDPETLSRLSGHLLLSGIVGARLAYVLAHAGDFVSRPWAVVAVWEGGLQFFGGFLAALAVLAVWLRRHRQVAPLVLVDGLSMALAAGMIVGRFGCLAVGEHLGGPTRFWLATRYLGGDTIEGPLEVGVAVHNTSLYEILGLLPLLGVLAFLAHHRPPPGTLLAVFALWYGAQRFATDFLRLYDRQFFGLTTAQYASMALFVFGAMLARRLTRQSARGTSPSEAPAANPPG